MVFVVVLALPLGVGAAIYMEEYARDTRLTRFINTNIRNLAGVPAIVYGILGLAIFVELLGSITGPDVEGRSLLAGGLTIASMVLPIVIITTQEALRAVPRSIREAGFGVGATRWEVDPQPRPAVRGAGGAYRAPSCRWPGRSGRRRR